MANKYNLVITCIDGTFENSCDFEKYIKFIKWLSDNEDKIVEAFEKYYIKEIL